MPKYRHMAELIEVHVEGYQFYMSRYSAENIKDSTLVPIFVSRRTARDHQEFMYWYERQSRGFVRKRPPHPVWRWLG